MRADYNLIDWYNRTKKQVEGNTDSNATHPDLDYVIPSHEEKKKTLHLLLM